MRKKTKTTYSYWKLSAILSVGLASLCLYQINEMTRDTYLVREYSEKVETLLEQRRRTEYDFLNHNSLSKIDNIIEENRGFERVENVHYIKITDTQVASK